MDEPRLASHGLRELHEIHCTSIRSIVLPGTVIGDRGSRGHTSTQARSF